MRAAGRPEVPVVPEIEKRVDVFIDFKYYISAVAAMAAVGLAFADASVAVEARAATTTVAGFRVYSGLVDKHFIEVRY